MRSAMRGVVIARTVAFAVLTLTFAGCRGGVSGSASVTTVAPSLTIDFTASLIDGSPIILGKQLAQQPVALWFWAPG